MIINLIVLNLLVTIKIPIIIYIKEVFFVFKSAKVLSRLNFFIIYFTLFYLELLNIIEKELIYLEKLVIRKVEV
jgi:hypothetical protein